ncbi:MAG: hypothetical protein K6T81_02620 [Alicyclobacillus macrosporangiidus]|uniref:hypothetical protein n=1 Tax=Alicyclobacillus macrosporangiidus TaxID=392015 RepID=UPI0026EB514D|nr:hypothetical protein [Alicyclobacillus macrosporangiidus]MCL6597619.1 hypothetical protein [Alicyclobacillus macrosporangiidus]
MERADELFLSAMEWLKDNYEEFVFFVERDIVWTLQTYIMKIIEKLELPFVLYNDHQLIPGKRADLAILDDEGVVTIAVEFKYEPSHKRTDITPGKFPVVMWSEVEKDVLRVKEFVLCEKAKRAYAILIDEGGHFEKKQPPQGAQWIKWGNGVSILWTKV